MGVPSEADLGRTARERAYVRAQLEAVGVRLLEAVELEQRLRDGGLAVTAVTDHRRRRVVFMIYLNGSVRQWGHGDAVRRIQSTVGIADAQQSELSLTIILAWPSLPSPTSTNPMSRRAPEHGGKGEIEASFLPGPRLAWRSAGRGHVRASGARGRIYRLRAPEYQLTPTDGRGMSTREQADVVRLDVNRHGVTVGTLVIVIAHDVVTFTLSDGPRLAVVERDELRQWFLRPERPITKGRLSFAVAGRYLEGISIDRGEQIIVPPFLSAILASSADRVRIPSC